jgi:hypothetical protein
MMHFYGVALLPTSVHIPDGVTSVSQALLHYQRASIALAEIIVCPMWFRKPFPENLPFIKIDSLLFRERWMGGFQLSFKGTRDDTCDSDIC